MSWVTITEADVVAKLSGPENAAMQTAALKVGQSNPLTAVIAQVVLEIRGYVSACERNTLGDGQTIPEELLGAAISRIRFELATRLPAALLNEDRRSANKDALQLLRDVAACRFLVVQPATAAADQAGGPGVEVVTSTTRRATRAKLDGL